MIKKLLAPLTAVTIALAAPAFSQSSTINTIFMMDESGSMSGEQSFIRTFVKDLDASLAISGFNQRNYGLLGFGSSSGVGAANIREFTVGTGQLGDDDQFVTASQGLVTNGSYEDGYAAINHVLQNYTLPTGTTTLVLITDEDRDNSNNALTYASILADLNAKSIPLVSMVNVTITDNNGTRAISTDGNNALVQTGSTFASNPHGNVTGNASVQHYSDLALATSGGCVADLNQLRSGGDAAAAFAAAFRTCVVNAATSQGVVRILSTPVRNVSVSVASNIRLQLRALALYMSNNGTGGFYSTQGDAVLDNMFGVEGLRGYGYVVGGTGSATGGVDLTSRGLTVGMDYTMENATGMARFGLALTGGKSTTKSSTSSVDTSTRQAQLYGLYRTTGGLQFFGDIVAGKMDNKNARVTGGTTAVGDSDTQFRTVSLEVGQRFAVGSPSNILMPYVGVSKERYEMDSYVDSAAATVPGYTQDISFGKLGLRWEHESSTQLGVLHTEVDATWNRVMNEDINMKTGTINAPLTATDRDRFDLALNFGVDTKAGGRVVMSIAGSKSENVKMGSLGLGFEMNF